MLVKKLQELTLTDLATVGEKAAMLGIALSRPLQSGIMVSDGFVFSKEAYLSFVEYNNLSKKIKQLLGEIKPSDKRTIERSAGAIRQLFIKGTLPKELIADIEKTFGSFGKTKTLIVRSSVVADADVSFAGLFESVGSIKTEATLQSAIKKCFSSLFSNAATAFYVTHSIDPRMLSMAVIVEKERMAEVVGTFSTSLPNFAGVATLEVGRKNSSKINRYILAKAQIAKDFASIIERTVTDAAIALQNNEIIELVKVGLALEKLYASGVVISLVKDDKGVFCITQVKRLPAIVHKAYESYRLTKTGKVLATGFKVGHAIVVGQIRFVNSIADVEKCTANDIAVLKAVDSIFDKLFGVVRAVILEDNNPNAYGPTMCRERFIPCLYGVKKAKQLFKAGQPVTISCAEEGDGLVYQGHLPFTVEKEFGDAKKTTTKLMLTLQHTDAVYDLASVVEDGIGLLSEETLYKKTVGIHPLALVQYKTLKDKKIRQQIEGVTKDYSSKGEFATDRLAEALAKVAVVANGKEVMFRLSAADTDDYMELIGGTLFEQKEKNPLLGWRGVSRYVDDRFKPAFALTCAAIKRVREEWGFENVSIMVPFCRTLEEARLFFEVLKTFGLERGKAHLKVYVMCEIPANVLLAKDLAKLFDGFSISLTNLTQLTFGADRTVFSTKRYNEDEIAIKQLVKEVIKIAHREGCSIGMCDADALRYPPFVSFLIQEGITSISVTPDHHYSLKQKVVAAEYKLGSVPLSWPQAVVSKSVSFAGVAGLSLMLAGFTCQPVNNQDVEQRVQTGVQDQLVAVRNQVRDEVRQQIAKEYDKKRAEETVDYIGNSFVSLSLKFPAGWNVEQTDTELRYTAPMDTWNWFAITRNKQSLAEAEDPAIIAGTMVTTSWSGIPALQFDWYTAEGSVTYKVIELYPDGFKKAKNIIRLQGDLAHFDAIVASIKDFEINK